MIVVTGATGQLGRRIVEQLLRRMSPDRIAATTRAPGKADALARAGVSVRHGDFAKTDTLRTAFADATQVLIVSSNAERIGQDPVTQHRAAIEAAKAAGARRVVYTSHMGASSTSQFRPMHAHARTEALLRDAGIAWTSLRNGFYAETVPAMLGDAVTTGVLRAPVDGKVAWTTHDDLAAAAAVVLAKPGRFDGPTQPLTGSEALDLADVASMLSVLHGRPIRRQVVADEAFAAGMQADGVPAAVIEITLGMYRAARAGEFAETDATLATLLGSAPNALSAVLAV
ncbi:NAD(P)H-binding protein [Methylobacterium sp. WL64]|uniref:NmrA family NAD(P)-binding protein n=1 Tax=Methylobacterium sp. WL64 TaxID=2603894 RepID=UPI0011CC683F|nr:NAD(P)H-binding protein [Methylobacterium sp. WL64]TXM99036.1 NAD(P)H-binding protein [Methylobacterium sp. WL64]